MKGLFSIVENMEKVENQRLDSLCKQLEKLTKDQAIISAAIQYKKSREIIDQKVKNENAAISYGIIRINKKVIENMDKYTEIENEYQEIMKKYEENLIELAQYHDSQIIMGYIKIFEEEIKQKEIIAKMFYAKKEEILAKGRVDNSDDQISEIIYDMEEELTKSEQKIRRTRTMIKKRIIQKENELTSLFETREKGIQKESIKGPKIFDKATKFFLGKLNPTKQIQRNVFNNLKKRIDEYEKNKIEIKIKDEYKEENIEKTLARIIEKMNTKE